VHRGRLEGCVLDALWADRADDRATALSLMRELGLVCELKGGAYLVPSIPMYYAPPPAEGQGPPATRLCALDFQVGGGGA
jgi:hypothetical protein